MLKTIGFVLLGLYRLVMILPASLAGIILLMAEQEALSHRVMNKLLLLGED